MPSITEKGMLVRLSITQWTARKHDKKITNEVAHAHNASADAGRYNKTLLAKSALEKVSQAATAVREFHYENTLPWRDDGARILPCANYQPYTDKMRSLKRAFESEVRDFLANYSAYVDDARVRLNGMFNEADYPPDYEVERRFSFETLIYPLPAAQDFRVTLADEELATIKADIENSVTQAASAAMGDLWQRVHDNVKHMHDRLSIYQVEDGKTKNRFHDTLVTNLRDLVELLPRLNLTGDARLEEMRQRLAKELCAEDPQTLRENEAARASVASAADQILRDMAGYTGQAAA